MQTLRCCIYFYLYNLEARPPVKSSELKYIKNMLMCTKINRGYLLFSLYFILKGKYREHSVTFSLGRFSFDLTFLCVFAGYNIGCKF